MSRRGSEIGGLLYDLHADGCDGTEYSTCRPVVVPERDGGYRIEAVFMAWCGDCGAADKEVV